MDTSFTVAHRHMLAYEGGYSNHRADPGGVTLNGVIQRVYDAWRRAKGLPHKHLTPKMNGDPAWNRERDLIYRENYWLPPGCPSLEPGVDAAIYDYSVNSGIGRGAKVLQRLVGVKVDGRVGPKTIAAANKRDAKVLVEAICDERLAFLKRLKHWPTFGVGWGRRVRAVRAYATALARDLPLTAARPVPGPTAKGEVPEPKKTKAAVGGGPLVPIAGEAARDGAGWVGWITANPGETVVLAVGVVGAVALLLYGINQWHRMRQEAATPGFGVVPELAA